MNSYYVWRWRIPRLQTFPDDLTSKTLEMFRGGKHSTGPDLWGHWLESRFPGLETNRSARRLYAVDALEKKQPRIGYSL